MKDEMRKTLAPSNSHPSITPRRRGGFTLIEILVVIGIILILTGILVPMVTRSFKTAGKIRVQADMEAITTALEAYKQDHGDYPRIPEGDPYNTGLIRPFKDTGAATLCKALIGPYGDGLTSANATDNSDPPAYNTNIDYSPGEVFRDSGDPNKMYVTLTSVPKGTAPADARLFARFDPLDGLDGQGFRKRKGGAGPVSPGYLASGKIAFKGSFLLDHYGNPILYFPAHSRRRDLTKPALAGAGKQPYVDISADPPGEPNPPMFDVTANMHAFARRDSNGVPLTAEVDNVFLLRMRVMLGDFNANGYLDNNPTFGPETAVNKPYLLWSAGADGMFGPAEPLLPQTGPLTDAQAVEYHRAVPKCDDVGNFR